jgi:hypothetical protein
MKTLITKPLSYGGSSNNVVFPRHFLLSTDQEEDEEEELSFLAETSPMLPPLPPPPPSAPQNSAAVHFLHDKWNLTYHLPRDSNWGLDSYKPIMTGIDSVESIIMLVEMLPEAVVKGTMLFFMRQHIAPLWEDPHNRQGGCFSFKVMTKQVCSVWRTLMYAACGETIFTSTAHSSKVCGITVSPKNGFCIMKIWLTDLEIQDSSLLTIFKYLPQQSCLFKKHEPEF